MIPDANSTASRWIQVHGGNFISHATTHYDDVFTSRAVRCAEEVLRQKGEMEHEAMGYRLRGVTNFDNAGQNEDLIEIILHRVSKKTNSLEMDSLIPKFAEKMVTDPECGYLKYPSDVKFEDCDLFWKLKSVRPAEVTNSADQIKSKRPRAKVIRSSMKADQPFSIKNDEIAKRPIDRSLRKIYQYLINKGLTEYEAHEAIGQYRNEVLALNGRRIAYDIAAEKNGVRWSYGPVAILMGNPESKITQPQTAMLRGEVRLKAPFQIEEGFYQEKVDNQENLILGPKYILDRYRAKPEIAESVKARFVDIESLSKEQWPMFELTEEWVKNLCTPPQSDFS